MITYRLKYSTRLVMHPMQHCAQQAIAAPIMFPSLFSYDLKIWKKARRTSKMATIKLPNAILPKE